MMLRSSRSSMILSAVAVLLVFCVGQALGANITDTGKGGGSGGGGGGGRGNTKKPKAAAVVAAPVAVMTPVDAVVTSDAKNATLQCLNATGKLTWKNSTGYELTVDIKTADGTPKYLFGVANLTVLKFAAKEDIGVYTCTDQKTEATLTVQLKMAPYVDKFNKGQSLTMVEGEVLQLACVIYAWPPPNVTWLFSSQAEPGQLAVVSQNASWVVQGQQILINGTSMVIKPVTRKSYLVFHCLSENAVGKGNSSVLVRVKGKFTAIWPFIGIVIEVVILIVIIVVFEKKKAKEIAQKQATMAEEEKLTTKSTPGKGSDGVRQRK